MVSEFRYDAASLSPSPKSAAGYLRVPGKLTRVGILPYLQTDGTIRKELRSAEEVFHPDSLDSLRLVPVTHGHPQDGLDAGKARAHARGAVGDVVTADGDYVTATVGVFDGALIEAIERGESELSCGYRCDLDMTPGEWNGEKYDAKQINIRYNHLAVVPRGRAGHDVALKLDSADQQEGRMAVLKIGGKDFDCSQEVADAFNALAKDSEAAASKAKADAADRDVQKARADAAEATAQKAKAEQPDVRALVKARVALEREATEFVSVDKMDAMDDVAIKAEVVKALLPTMNLDGASEARVNVAYEAAIASRPSKSVEGLSAIQATQRNDNKQSARDQMLARQANAWKAKEIK